MQSQVCNDQGMSLNGRVQSMDGWVGRVGRMEEAPLLMRAWSRCNTVADSGINPRAVTLLWARCSPKEFWVSVMGHGTYLLSSLILSHFSHYLVCLGGGGAPRAFFLVSVYSCHMETPQLMEATSRLELLSRSLLVWKPIKGHVQHIQTFLLFLLLFFF